MRILRPAMPLLAAVALVLDAAAAHAETPVDRSLDGVWTCVEDFAAALARNSPLSIDAITEQALRSCNAEFEGYRRTLTESPLQLSPDEIEARVGLPRATAKPFVVVLWDRVRAEQAAAREKSELDQYEAQLGRRNAPDRGIWANPDLTEEETAEARRPSFIPPDSDDRLPQP